MAEHKRAAEQNLQKKHRQEGHARVEQKSFTVNSIGRLVVALVLIILQIVWIYNVIVNIEGRFPGMSSLISLCALVAAFAVYNRNMNSSYKIFWMVIIASLPVLGVLLYVLMGRKNSTKGMRQRYQRITRLLEMCQDQDPEAVDILKKKNPRAANEYQYLWNIEKQPVYGNSDVFYFADSADGLADQIEELKKAKSFIFMEYHAIENKESFRPVKEVLAQKAKEGVEVRLFYDDIGSAGFINGKFIQEMESYGVHTRVFNPVVPVLNIFMNNRDHRKITVIDGKVGYTGGYNLANEYFHITEPYGYWKDTGVKIVGEAVKGLTSLFLEGWNSMKVDEEELDRDLDQYFPKVSYKRTQKRGFVASYGGNPLFRERVAEEAYMNVLRSAKRYCWFVTPYLIITDEMTRELTGAAKRGVDVRIITPGVPDKKFIYHETRSFYPQLVRDGVKITEFTPGFCHAKMCVSDDTTAIVGTINLDYRSLYLHFENAVLMYGTPCVKEIKEDFDRMLEAGRDVSEKYKEKHFRPVQVGRTFLRFIAPLL